MSLDTALRSINDHGRAQLTILLLMCLMAEVPSSWHTFGIVFLGAIPDHVCILGEEAATGYSGEIYSRCGPEGTNSSDVAGCQGWVYSNATYGSTIVTEWDLVCSRASLVEFAQLALIIGITIGSLVAGYISDRFGRKNIFFASLFIFGLLGCLGAFSTSYEMFIIVRILIGCFDQGVNVPLWGMASELFTPRCRPFTFPVIFVFWSIGLMALPVIAHVTRSWRFLQLTISIPSLLTPLLYRFIPESPRWLLSVGRDTEASAVIKRMASINGRPNATITLSTPEEVQMTVDHEDVDDVTYDVTKKEARPEDYHELRIDHEVASGTAEKNMNVSYLDLFRGVWISLVTILLFLIWLVSAITYYGLTLNAGRLVGDPYLNFFINGAVECPAIIINIVTVTRFGRRLPLAFFFVIASLCGFVTTMIPETTDRGTDLTAVIITAAMVAKFAITISFHTICLCTVELFPTVIRTKGIAFVGLAVRLGAMIAPFILLLAEIVPRVPMILFASISFLPCLAVFLLPEMKGKPQPQTVSDLNKLFKSRRLTKRTAIQESEQGR